MPATFDGKVADSTFSSPGTTLTVPLTGSVSKSPTTGGLNCIFVWVITSGTTAVSWSAAPSGIIGAVTDDAVYDGSRWGTRWAPYANTAGGSGSGRPDGRANPYYARGGGSFSAAENFRVRGAIAPVFADLSTANSLSIGGIPAGISSARVIVYGISGLTEFSLFSTTTLGGNGFGAGSSGPLNGSNVLDSSGTSFPAGSLAMAFASDAVGAGTGRTATFTFDASATIDDTIDFAAGRLAFGHRIIGSTTTTEKVTWSAGAGDHCVSSYPNISAGAFAGTVPDQLTAGISATYIDSGSNRIYTVTVTDMSGLAANTTDHNVLCFHRISAGTYVVTGVTGTGPTYSYSVTVATGATTFTDAFIYDGVMSNVMTLSLIGQGVFVPRLPLLGVG